MKRLLVVSTVVVLVLLTLAVGVLAGEPIGPEPESHIHMVSFDTATKTFVYEVDADDLQHNISHTTLTTCTEAEVLACGHVDEFGVQVESGCTVGQDQSIEPPIEHGIKWERTIPIFSAEQYWVTYEPPIYASMNRSCVKFGAYSFCELVEGPCGEPTGVTLLGLKVSKVPFVDWFISLFSA